MPDRIKLTENDIRLRDADGTIGCMIYTESGYDEYVLSDEDRAHEEKCIKEDQIAMDKAKKLKQQIIDDHDFVTELGDGWKDIIKFVRETKQENKQLKEKAEFKHKLELHNEKEFVKVVKDRDTLQKKLDGIQVYCLCKQDGDPENENPKEILDSIEKILGNEYYGGKND